MPTNDERREVARRLRGNPEDTLIPHRTGRHHGMGCHEAADRFWNMCDRIKEAGNYDIAFSTASVLADLIEPEQERTCKWVWGEEWLESSPMGPRELQWANWYLNCGCWDGFEDEFEDLCDPEEKPAGHWKYCPECGAKVVDE